MEQKTKIEFLRVYSKFILSFEQKKHPSIDLLLLPEYADTLFIPIDDLLDKEIQEYEHADKFPEYIQKQFYQHCANINMEVTSILLNEFNEHFKLKNLKKFIKKSFLNFKQDINQQELFEDYKTTPPL